MTDGRGTTASTPGAGWPSPAGERNNFHLLRLLLALMVVAYHLVTLTQVPAWSQAEGFLSYGAQLGVQGFFVLSGYLVFGSLEHSSSIGQYAEKRVRRLYPAYAVVILTGATIALAVSAAARADRGAVVRYVGWNLGFLNFMQPTLPGLFVNNRFTEVNGALWTLKIEVLFYLILPVLGWMIGVAGRFRWVLIVAIYVAAEGWRFGFIHLGQSHGRPILLEVARQLPGQMSFFITGVAFYLRRGQIDWRSRLAPAGLILLIVSYIHPALEPLRAAGLGIVIIWAATAIPRLVHVAAIGDLSYGLYILHFPIVQGGVALGLFAASPWQGTAIVIGATFIAAECMWWMIERPALRRDSAYRRAS